LGDCVPLSDGRHSAVGELALKLADLCRQFNGFEKKAGPASVTRQIRLRDVMPKKIMPNAKADGHASASAPAPFRFSFEPASLLTAHRPNQVL